MSNCLERIREYLIAGGLFNPELMEHSKVSELIQDCREEITKLEAELAQQRFNNEHNLSIDQKVSDEMVKLKAENEMMREYLSLALSFAPKGEVPNGLFPTSYFTLNYEEDVKIQKKIDAAREILKKIDENKEGIA